MVICTAMGHCSWQKWQLAANDSNMLAPPRATSHRFKAQHRQYGVFALLLWYYRMCTHNTFKKFQRHPVQLQQRKPPFPLYSRLGSLSIFALVGSRRLGLGFRGFGLRLFHLTLLTLRVWTKSEAIDGNFEPARCSTVEVAALNLCRHDVDCQLKRPRTYFRLDLAEVPGDFFFHHPM